MAPFSIVRARSSSERTTHVVSGFDTRAHAMSREGEHAASGGDVAVIQEVRGLAEELTNLRQENTILQGNFDEVRFRAAFRSPRPAHLRPPGTDLRLLSFFTAQLKAHHKKIQTAYDSLASQYHDLTNEKNDMERFYKEQVETWRGDLELKHAQFEEARAGVSISSISCLRSVSSSRGCMICAREAARVRGGDRGADRAVHASRARLGDAAHGARRRGGAFA